MDILADLTIEEMKEIAAQAGQPPFRAAQLFDWVSLGVPLREMSNIPTEFKNFLNENYITEPIKISKALTSKDGSEKYLYELHDGNLIEGVYMPHDYGDTVCVSTQVGCRMGCAFCASGLDGLIRNLSPGEMLMQVAAANRRHGGSLKNRKISNIVLMGSGEPLDNFDNVMRFLNLVSHEKGLKISRRSISLSTCGLADKIIRLADESAGVTLSVSLHATTDEIRGEIMPVARAFNLEELKNAARYYFEKTGRRVIYEYAMIKGKNIHFLDAQRLREFTKGYSAHVNLIMLNPVKERKLEGCSKIDADRFLKRLTDLGVSATIRRSFGSDIDGACGQLRNTFVKTNLTQ